MAQDIIKSAAADAAAAQAALEALNEAWAYFEAETLIVDEAPAYEDLPVAA